MTALKQLLLSGRGYCKRCGEPVETFELSVSVNSRSVGYPICNDCYNEVFSLDGNYLQRPIISVRRRQNNMY